MSLWGNYYRIVVLIVGFVCLASVCSNYIVINFTFICMKSDFENGYLDGNGVITNNGGFWILSLF